MYLPSYEQSITSAIRFQPGLWRIFFASVPERTSWNDVFRYAEACPRLLSINVHKLPDRRPTADYGMKVSSEVRLKNTQRGAREHVPQSLAVVLVSPPPNTALPGSN